MIKQFVQGDDNGELYCAIGRWAISKVVHEALGVAVTGEVGDVWFVSFNGSVSVGFSQYRLLKNKKCHIRYLHAESEKHSLLLAKAAIAAARAEGVEVVFTNDRECAEIWPKLGFTLHHSHHGSFGRWEKNLK